MSIGYPRGTVRKEHGAKTAVAAVSSRGRRPRVERDALGRNKTEAAYAQYLDLLVKSGEIEKWRFQSLRLRLGAPDDGSPRQSWYWPDFEILLPSGAKELHDVKGHMEDDALVKIKTAASLYSEYRFYTVSQDGRGWKCRKF